MAEAAHALYELEPTEGWPDQGEWTWEDYLRLPEDGKRYEILEGVLYVSPAPTFDHQFSVVELLAELRSFVRPRGLGLVLTAPFDVRLPNVSNPVQPDVVFFRSGNEPRSGDRYFLGVPDLIVEVLSPGSSRFDRGVKLEAYEKAGVPEYWLVDVEKRAITVHALDAPRRRYRRFGRFGEGEAVRSALLEGFETAVTPLFPPQRF